MKYFTIKELCASATAAKLGIKNEPTLQQRNNLRCLVEKVLDPIRERWGAPIIVNSGFRCPAVNKAVMGALNSQHMRGQAADIRPKDKTKIVEFKNTIKQMMKEGLVFDQAIFYPTFMHISYKPTLGANRKQLIIKTLWTRSMLSF